MVKVLLTGAGGRLGRRLCPALAREKDLSVTACDIKVPRDVDFGLALEEADLRDLGQVQRLTGGQDVVIHMGNYSDFSPPDPYLIFNQNVCMNQNVMQSAADAGVKKILFASSIQVVGSTPFHNKDVWDDRPAYLPLDEKTPENCRNPYALSKLCGEEMLKYLVRQYDIAGRAIRFPAILTGVHEFEPKRAKTPHLDDYYRPIGFAYIHYDDACELLIRLIKAQISGFGVMFPASRTPIMGGTAKDAVARHYQGVPLHVPVEKLEGLIDQAHVVRDLGWRPGK
jgi:nucleoside-diphosphate-sugar epimerase